MMQPWLALVYVLLLCVDAPAAELASAPPTRNSELSKAEIHGTLHKILTEFVATNAAVPGAALFVDSPRHGLKWAGAAGLADRKHNAPLTPEHPVRIASVTKTFVAVGILRLVEDGSVRLDDSIERYLSPESIRILKTGKYRSSRITVRHLLTHRAGLVDYYENKTFMKLAADAPKRRWTRHEQLTYAMEAGRPLTAPGKGYSYSDTGYILLGEILERQTGQSMGAALRELIGYSRLNMDSTWHETFEPQPKGLLPRAHQYEGERDTFDIDPSIDLYGGGGLVSTVGDMAKFMRGLFTGKVFAKADTLKVMLSAPAAFGRNDYRMGIAEKKISGVKVYLHHGYWGTTAAYAPAFDLAMAISIGQQTVSTDRLLESVLNITRSSHNRQIEEDSF